MTSRRPEDAFLDFHPRKQPSRDGVTSTNHSSPDAYRTAKLPNYNEIEFIRWYHKTFSNPKNIQTTNDLYGRFVFETSAVPYAGRTCTNFLEVQNFWSERLRQTKNYHSTNSPQNKSTSSPISASHLMNRYIADRPAPLFRQDHVDIIISAERVHAMHKGFSDPVSLSTSNAKKEDGGLSGSRHVAHRVQSEDHQDLIEHCLLFPESVLKDFENRESRRLEAVNHIKNSHLTNNGIESKKAQLPPLDATKMCSISNPAPPSRGGNTTRHGILHEDQVDHRYGDLEDKLWLQKRQGGPSSTYKKMKSESEQDEPQQHQVSNNISSKFSSPSATASKIANPTSHNSEFCQPSFVDDHQQSHHSGNISHVAFPKLNSKNNCSPASNCNSLYATRNTRHDAVPLADLNPFSSPLRHTANGNGFAANSPTGHSSQLSPIHLVSLSGNSPVRGADALRSYSMRATISQIPASNIVHAGSHQLKSGLQHSPSAWLASKQGEKHC